MFAPSIFILQRKTKMFEQKFRLIAILLLLGLGSCTSPRLMLHQDLRESSDCYQVEGRMALRIKPRLAFGPYSTTHVWRGAVRSYQWTAGVRTRGGSQKMKIILANPSRGAFDTIQTNARMKERDLPLWNGRIALPLTYRNLLTGEIRSSLGNAAVFALYAGDHPWASVERCGHLEIPGEPLLEIFRYNTVEGGRQIPWARGLGYRLVQNSKTIAQATVINRGEVCISSNLDPDLEHRIASLFSVILLMQNLD